MISVRSKVVLRSAVLAVTLAGILTVATATAANAHDGLVDSSPAADSTVTTELTSIDLEFSEDFLDLGTATSAFAIQVSGPDGKFYNTGCVTLDGATITTSAALGASGDYEVVWQVVSSDGHPTSDSFGFRYVQPDGATAAEGAESGVTCADAIVADDQEAANAGPGWIWIVVVVIVALIAIAVLAVVLVRRGKRATS
ncbi:MAG: copper resistance protein CopC [Salinibacterium sp.]|nr:copper resistance protein CopC [Salinibacterium sp.]